MVGLVSLTGLNFVPRFRHNEAQSVRTLPILTDGREQLAYHGRADLVWLEQSVGYMRTDHYRHPYTDERQGGQQAILQTKTSNVGRNPGLGLNKLLSISISRNQLIPLHDPSALVNSCSMHLYTNVKRKRCTSKSTWKLNKWPRVWSIEGLLLKQNT